MDQTRQTRQTRDAQRNTNPARAREPRKSRAVTLDVVEAPVAQLRPWPDNPRTMPTSEMESLRRSVSHWGLVEPLVVRRADQLVIGGHQRLEVAKALGMATVPVVYVELAGTEAKALNLALNRIHGEWDLPRLGELLEDLQRLPDIDEGLTGFGADEIDSLLAELGRDRAPDPREESFPEAAEALQAWRGQAPTRVSGGDLWQPGRHRLYCGDSLAPGGMERLCDGGKVDLTDPPYGVGYQSTLAARGRRKKAIANDGQEEFESFLERALPALRAVMKRGAVWYWFAGGGGAERVLAKALLAVSRHLTLLNLLVWDKMDAGLGWRWRRSWEAVIEASVGRPRVWHGGTDRRNVLRFPRAIPQSDDHPTPKPVPLLEEIVLAAAPARGTILDPFAGSGSTVIAAERTGRTCVAVELEPRYCDMVLARWEVLTGGQARPVRPARATRSGGHGDG
jgi:DNA modification methylase